jgi:hypothetical protein
VAVIFAERTPKKGFWIRDKPRLLQNNLMWGIRVCAPRAVRLSGTEGDLCRSLLRVMPVVRRCVWKTNSPGSEFDVLAVRTQSASRAKGGRKTSGRVQKVSFRQVRPELVEVQFLKAEVSILKVVAGHLRTVRGAPMPSIHRQPPQLGILRTDFDQSDTVPIQNNFPGAFSLVPPHSFSLSVAGD